MKHTPGPWEYQYIEGLPSPLHRISDSENLAIAEVFHGRLETKGNAYLIAAAPKLLEALKKIAYAKGTSGILTGNDAVCFMNIAEKAIAKAEGQDE